MSQQKIIYADSNYKELDKYIDESHTGSILLVCDSSLPFLRISKYFDNLEKRESLKLTRFDDFKPNPLYESVVEGVELFHKNNCDLIIAVGGGSAIDVAKCIKLYSNMNPDENYLKQKIVPNDVPLLAMPTTAGTGSESTRYAVIYFDVAKQSVSDYSCIPSTVLFDPTALTSLPLYQKKSTMMDALCHSIESCWSVNSTEESKEYSKKAIELILENKDRYINDTDDEVNSNMFLAANLAGKAINITQTTAGHAMSYKITSLYGISHGHAVAVCLPVIFEYMINHIDDCSDPRGKEYLAKTFDEIAKFMGAASPKEAVAKFCEIKNQLGLDAPVMSNKDDLEVLAKSVNPVRLKNNPVALDEKTLKELYIKIFNLK